ncbi:MAG: bifunctional oligoribonuclease/PAP phosphatase NrnA [Bacteroidales bacterium]|jgi:phosphoesterase RecJ-like protein|nr:bifunctional oligoribonuclease/PAP phosphatase NrnA [Bacteroidales bacterium]
MTSDRQQQVINLKNELATPRRIVLTNHQGPDGDAMGAMTALYQFLRKMGHEVTMITPNDYPEFLHWLPCNSETVNFMRQKEMATAIIEKADYIFHLDYNQIKRSADMFRPLSASKAVRILIDHHPDPSLPANYLFSDSNASSTCELLFNILKIWDASLIDRDIAGCLYTGIMTDTGCFSYRSATSYTFTVVSELLVYGIDRDAIYNQVYDNFSAQRMRLMGYCLNSKMEIFPEYRAALITLSLEEQRRYDFATGDSEGFVNLPLSVNGVRFTAFFLEKDDKIKISFRSKGSFSVNDFARKHFSGGGHLNASGGEARTSLDETVRKFRELLPLYKDELHAQ